MIRTSLILALAVLLFHLPVGAERPADLDAVLSFEVDQTDERPSGWGGGPKETLHADAEVVRAGKWSGRIERDTNSEASFSTLKYTLDVDFAGTQLELRAWLKTEEVADGQAVIWLRVDGHTGSLEFRNNQDLDIRGTTDWTEYVVQVPMNKEGRNVVFGALLSGTGRVWVDDVTLLLDGTPVSEAKVVELKKTVLDTDTEFEDGSGIEIGELSDVQVDNLTRLGKVWGFLKYHHPAVTAGGHHWDFELFRVLPSILDAADRAAANAAMLDWIGRLGEVEACERCARLPDDDVHLEPPLKWLDDEPRFGTELAATLRRIHANRDRRGKHFFVGPASYNVGNPQFQNEPAYTSAAFPDAGLQLLTLFRYWNIIEYWFPYRDVIGENWDAVLAEYVPRLALVRERDVFEREVGTLIARINDTHAGYSSKTRPPTGRCAAQVSLRVVEGGVVVTEGASLERGDLVEEIGGTAVEELLEEWGPYYAASNEPTRRHRMARSLTVGECGEVEISGRREGKRFRETLLRVPLAELNRRAGWRHDRPGETFQRLHEDVAYLKLSSVETDEISSYVMRAYGTKGLIVDIRNYPSEFVVFTLGGRFVDRPTPFARFTKPNYSNPGLFGWTQGMVLTPQQPGYDGKVAILVDATTISQAEYTAMALRAGPNAAVIGSTTAAADGNLSSIGLPYGLRTAISGIGVFYPDKTPTQRIGIVPDIEVLPTIEGIREGRDEVLERAIRWIRESE